MTEEEEEKMRTVVAGVVFAIVVIVIIVVILVPGKEGPMGSKGLPGATGPSGYSDAEMGPVGDTGATGATGSTGTVGYNKWIAVSLSGESTVLPYQGAVRYVNYYWNSNSGTDLHVHIDGTQYKPGDIFTITNLNSHASLWINPSNFQNMANDQSTNYGLQGGVGALNTALIIVTSGATNTDTPDPNAILINLSYSVIHTANISSGITLA